MTTHAPCDPCGTFTVQLGPYFLPVSDDVLYAHYQCRVCGRVRIPFGKSPSGKQITLSYVEPRKVGR